MNLSETKAPLFSLKVENLSNTTQKVDLFKENYINESIDISLLSNYLTYDRLLNSLSYNEYEIGEVTLQLVEKENERLFSSFYCKTETGNNSYIEFPLDFNYFNRDLISISKTPFTIKKDTFISLKAPFNKILIIKFYGK